MAIQNKYPGNEELQNILKTSCYDCHSNNTVYPWYAKVQPAALFLGNHIRDGKKELNFDEFLSYRLAKQFHKIEEVLEKNEMPLSSYTLLHRNAILTTAQKQVIYQYADNILAQMRTQYPADSLILKKRSWLHLVWGLFALFICFASSILPMMNWIFRLHAFLKLNKLKPKPLSSVLSLKFV